MAIESKNLLVWVKAMSRGQALPLDASEVYSSYSEAQAYAGTATAYAGQTIKALLEDGKYHSYTLQPSEAGYVLEEVGALKASDLKQFVMVVDSLPTSGQEQGILYIVGTTGKIWTGSEWRTVFWDCDIYGVEDRIFQNVKDNYAPIANPVFTGSVKLKTGVDAEGKDVTEEVALKSYVESLFAQLEETTVPGIVDSTHAIPTEYKAGMSYRVAEAGTYAGQKCEVGDLVLVINDYAEDTASNNDFLVIQANIDGAVTSTATTTTVGEIVVFDAVTGKVIKGSGVQIASLNDAIAKAHEHSNKEKLDTYDKTQTELLDAAKTTAESLIAELQKEVDDKANAATTLAGYGITDAYTTTVIDSKLKTITDNLNTKVTSSDVSTAINEAIKNIPGDIDEAIENKVGEIGEVTVKKYVDSVKNTTLSEAATAANTAIENRVGAIPADTTIKSYVDTAVGAGGTASAQAIATAKQEAIDTSKGYTDTQITNVYNAITVVEF